MVMTKRKLLTIIDTVRIEEAIRKAEEMTSGEVCVTVSRLFWGSVDKAADKAFVRLGMTQTAQHNGVLFFVVPSRKRFVVLGDSGIHEKVGQEFWNNVVKGMGDLFHAGDFTGGLVKGIDQVGQQLATHFPYDRATDKNELSNKVNFE